MAAPYQESYGGGPDDYGPGPGGYGQDHGIYGAPPEHYDYDARYMDPEGQRAPSEGLSPGDDESQSYQKYTERGLGTGPPSIDTETGIAPRRCTDTICLFVFLAYVLGMIILVSAAKTWTIGNRHWGDISRLTHGHDYKGRLCGIDEGVQDKEFLYWCRDSAIETSETPSKLNLEFPSCVSKCPRREDAPIPCLFKETVEQMSIQGGPFATVETYHVQFQQSTALTHPYDTEAFGGRFCVPTNSSLKGQILHGPMRFSRWLYSVGSLQDPWWVMFQATVLAIALGYLYVFLIRLLPKLFIFVFLYSTYVIFLIAGGFFLYAVVGIIAQSLDNDKILEKTMFAEYMENNPLFGRYSPQTAAVLSMAVAAVLWCVSCGVLGTISHVGEAGFQYVPDLIDAASECWMIMPSMLVPPAIEALLKFFLTWILAYNFMYLVSVGWYEERRLMVNEMLYKDETAVYHFDTRVVPWILYYLFGWVWIVELTTACGQFLISFSVISWYFMKKEGDKKTGVPPMPPVHGSIDGVLYHAGSLCLGAAIIPWVRLIRIFNWIEDESVPNEDAACCALDSGPCGSACNRICQCIGGCCNRITTRRKACTPAWCGTKAEPRIDSLCSTGCAYRYMKNAYNDVIIRSQHFLQASQRSFLVIHKYQSTKTFLLEGQGCQVVTAVGVVSIGCICMLYTYFVIMRVGHYTDPTSSTFIAEPIAIAVMAFFLCGNIGYGFMMLFDHTADTLLYCYAWNKQFFQESGGNPVSDYLPETLRDLVDADLDQPDTHCFYGQARPEMYLHTWLPSRRMQRWEERPPPAPKGRQPAAGGLSPSQSWASGRSGTGGPQQYGYPPGPQAPYQAMSGGYGPAPGYQNGNGGAGYGSYGGQQ